MTKCAGVEMLPQALQVSHQIDAPVSTGIEELDQALQGGFLSGQIVLLAGNPGSGKTSFGVPNRMVKFQ